MRNHNRLKLLNNVERTTAEKPSSGGAEGKRKQNVSKDRDPSEDHLGAGLKCRLLSPRFTEC